MRVYLYSVALLFNSFSMTALMLLCGLIGKPQLTADIAIVQGSTLALFFAFSANARNMIFSDPTHLAARTLLKFRLILLLPVAGASLFLSSWLGSVSVSLAVVLIFRRSMEWIGEIYLSSFEFQNLKIPASITIVAEISTLSMAIILLFIFKIDPVISMVPWAFAPAITLFCGNLVRSERSVKLRTYLKQIAPNFGSTAIIGMSTYIFRLSIVLLTGRALAGELFTAFAIGGILPTVYNGSIGPSLVLKKQQDGIKTGIGKKFFRLSVIFFLAGALLVVLALSCPDFSILSKNSNFWTAVGLSLAAGSIMLHAVHNRLFMLQCRKNVEVFGIDVISNIIIITAVPYFYYLLGIRSLEALYLFSAGLTFCLYWRSKTNKEYPIAVQNKDAPQNFIFILVSGLILMPVFFQLEGSIFRDVSTSNFDSGGMLKKVPIPISVTALIYGIMSLRKFGNISRSTTMLFSMVILMTISALFVGKTETKIDRLILMAQYCIPVCGLILGEMFGSSSNHFEFEKTCLFVVGLIVPLQLICSWLQGSLFISPFMYLFSIYQYLQYVPAILVLAYCIAFGVLREEKFWYSLILFILLPFISIYTVASFSLLAMATLVSFAFIFFFLIKKPLIHFRTAICMMIIIFISGFSYGIFAKTALVDATVLKKIYFLTSMTDDAAVSAPGNKNELSGKDSKPSAYTNQAEPFSEKSGLNSSALKLSYPKNIQERLVHWRFYASGIVEDTRTFFFGHPHPPDRNIHPSAHNYYLDIIYNYGFIAIIPLIILLVYLAFSISKLRKPLFGDPKYMIYIFAIIIVFIIENSLTVGLRQPYSGIFSFFILGLFQARLDRFSGKAM